MAAAKQFCYAHVVIRVLGQRRGASRIQLLTRKKIEDQKHLPANTPLRDVANSCHKRTGQRQFNPKAEKKDQGCDQRGTSEKRSHRAQDEGTFLETFR